VHDAIHAGATSAIADSAGWCQEIDLVAPRCRIKPWRSKLARAACAVTRFSDTAMIVIGVALVPEQLIV
jgi:hypothetical protein